MEASKIVALMVGLLAFAVPVGYVTLVEPTPVSRPGAAGTVEGDERDAAGAGTDGAAVGVEVPSMERLEKAAKRPLVRKQDLPSVKKIQAAGKASTKGTKSARADRGVRTGRRGLAARSIEPREFEWEPPARRHLKPREVAFLLKDAGFPVSAIPRLVCTAKYESLFDTRATNENRNGSADTGLFQINDIWLKECGVTRAQLMDPEVNAACARKVFKEHGYWAWYAYRKKEEECKNYRLSSRTMAIIGAR